MGSLFIQRQLRGVCQRALLNFLKDEADLVVELNDILSCPACNSSGFSPTGGEAPGFPIRIGESSFVQQPYSVLECIECGLLYKNQTLSTAEFSDYYALVDFRKWETEGLYPTERAVLDNLKKLKQGSKILDIGCSSGRLLSSLVDSYECFGYELNDTASQEAKGKGIRMLSTSELEALPSNSYDAVVMVDVFEHLLGPLEYLQRLTDLIKVGGFLVIVTGDGDNKLSRRDAAQFWYFRIIEHVVMLTGRHISWLEKQLNLTLKSRQRISHYDWDWQLGLPHFLKNWAYWKFRDGNGLLKVILRYIPEICKAEHWDVAPQYEYSADHLVVVFQK